MKYKIFILILLAVTICSCSSERQGLKELKRLCEKDAGLTIYKTVEADGYFDATGNGIDLVKSQYSFYEYCDDDPTFIDIEPGSGCYRVEKVKRETGRCHQWFEDRLGAFIVDPYPEFLENHCIAVTKIEKITAMYSYEVENVELWVNEKSDSQMSRSKGRVVNTKTRKVLGERVNYIFDTPKYSSPPTISCGSYHITGLQKSIPFAAGLREKTLVASVDGISGETK